MDRTMSDHLSIQIGERYRYHGKEFQIIDVRGDRIQLRSLESNRVIIYHSFEQLVLAHQRNDFQKLQEAPFSLNATCILAALTPAHKIKLDKRLCYVKAILEKFGGRLPRLGVGELAGTIALELGDEKTPAYSTLYNWTKAYLLSGENSLALAPKTRSADLHRFYRQSAEVQTVIKNDISLLYFTETPCTKTELIDAIDQSLRAHNEGSNAEHQLAIPSTSTLYRIITELDTYETDLHQIGRRDAIKNQRWSRKNPRPSRRFELVEGDTKVLNVQTCDEQGKLIGRPQLTGLIEVRTRMLVGWDISYNPPCAEKTLRALKTSLIRSNPYGGLAAYYRVDNGSEFIASRIKNTLADMGAHITFCGPGEPDKKPFIESFFHTVDTSFFNCLRGATFSKPTHYDSERNAIYTLSEVKDFFSQWLDSTYHRKCHSGLGMSPVEAWALDDKEQQGFALKKYDEAEILRHFLCVAYITPNNGRLRFKGLAWTGPAVSYLAAKKPKKKLRVLYDESELGHAWVCDPEHPSEIYEVMGVAPEYQDGLTMHMHNLVKAALGREMKEDNYRAALDERVELLRKIALRNNKSVRKGYEISQERGDFKKIPTTALVATTNAPPALPSPVDTGQYHFHRYTPECYETREVNHEPLPATDTAKNVQ